MMDLQRLKTELDVSHVRSVGFRPLSNFYLYENTTMLIEVKNGKVVFYLGDGHLWKDGNRLIFRAMIEDLSTVLDITDIDKSQLFNESVLQELYGLDMECIDVINEVEKIAKEAKILK